MKIIKKAARVLLGAAAMGNINYFTSAIILAAGKSTRMGGGVPKQVRMIASLPVVVRSVLAFDRCEKIDEIIIVTGEEQLAECEEYKEKFAFKKPVRVVLGGKTRAESSRLGFEAISKRAEFVAIHDAARCLIKPEDISRVLKAAYIYGAAIAVEPSTDTLKRVDGDGFIEETVDRASVFRAQTPQVFMREVYETSVYTPHKNGFNPTDDASLAEASGYRVKTVPVGSYNLKITTEDDFRAAEKIIESEEA